MAYPLTSGISTPGANTKSANLVSGTNMFVPRGRITVVAKSSATGIYADLKVGNVSVCNDMLIPYTGTAGTISANDNVMCSQMVAGGAVEFTLFNKTATAGTTADYQVWFEPGGK